MSENETSNALFNAYDIRKTLESNGLMNIKRVHGGTENEETLKDLISDVILFLEKADEVSLSETLFKEEAVHAYPDGWTCVHCGDEYSENTTDVKDFYVINTEEGTLCLKCYEPSETIVKVSL